MQMIALAGNFGLSANKTSMLNRAAADSQGSSDMVELGTPVNYVAFLKFIFNEV